MTIFHSFHIHIKFKFLFESLFFYSLFGFLFSFFLTYSFRFSLLHIYPIFMSWFSSSNGLPLFWCFARVSDRELKGNYFSPNVLKVLELMFLLQENSQQVLLQIIVSLIFFSSRNSVSWVSMSLKVLNCSL